MVQPAEVRRREKREHDAAIMRQAATIVRERGRGGFAGLDPDSAEPVAELLELVAEGWRTKPAAPRVWDQAVRVAERMLEPDRDPAPHFPGPLPAGYESPVGRDISEAPL